MQNINNNKKKPIQPNQESYSKKNKNQIYKVILNPHQKDYAIVGFREPNQCAPRGPVPSCFPEITSA